MIYLDNAATSWPKAPPVAEALSRSVIEPIGNVGRSAHQAALAASQIVYDFREAMQRHIPRTDVEKTIITRNATEAINIALLGSVHSGDIILTTVTEHNAVARPLSYLKSQGVQVIEVHCDPFGRIDSEDFLRHLKEQSITVAVFTAANNITGTVNPVEELVAACIAYRVPFIIDAAQVVGEMRFADFPEGASGALCCSIHKGLLGPAGVGVMALYGDFSPRPLWYGGTGSRSESVLQPDFLPDQYESGTPAVHAIAGANAALAYCAEHAGNITHTRNEMADLLYQQLNEIEELKMLSPERHRVPVISVSVRSGTVSTIARGLFQQGIAIRSGLHCAPLMHQHLKTIDRGGALRFSPGFQTTAEEITTVISVLKEIFHDSRY
jgi:selenocysteine lyase/cysteine desulfurase